VTPPHKRPLMPPAGRNSLTPHTPTDLLARVEVEGAIGQLRQQSGLMRQLGSEGGAPMLDWVEAVPRLLADPEGLEAVEREARTLLTRGVRHVIWSGMGGSVLSVQVLRALGFCGEGVTIHPLDSTDPEALNALLRRLATGKGVVSLSADASADAARVRAPLIRALFADVLMVAVAMGKTSEEPISHLEWFSKLLREGGLDLADHLVVMSIPGSYLEQHALTHGLPHLPLQLDGGHGTPGRMSAPTTRVFLLPVALHLAAQGAPEGSLRAILRTAWTTYDLDGATARPHDHPYVRLAATLAAAAADGACGLLLALPPELDALRWWTEQLLEESLGKGGKGIVVFADQALAVSHGTSPAALPCVRVHMLAEAPPATADSGQTGVFALYQPLLAVEARAEQLAGVAAVFLGLQLTMALYGYLWDIPFAGQPAVEAYKSRARELRAADDALRIAHKATVAQPEGRLTLLPPPASTGTSAGESPALLVVAALGRNPTYLDLTINGELSQQDMDALYAQLRALGNDGLGIPVKLRRAPASYHSTEQSEMDGPAGLVSLRALAAQTSSCLLGSYEARFLRAQAVGTWMAMNEQGRACYLLVYDGTADGLAPAVVHFLAKLAGTADAARRGEDGGSIANV
jgi:hypothetical protein